MNTLLIPLLSKAGDLISKFIPDPEAKAKAQLELLQLADAKEARELQAEIEAMKTAMSAINTEGASADKWTSRARPSFLYVVYVVILMGIPLSVLAIWFPSEMTVVQQTFSAWVKGIPGEVWTLFGVGYLGYAGARTWEKTKGVSR